MLPSVAEGGDCRQMLKFKTSNIHQLTYDQVTYDQADLLL
jgi:hypothetical protein